MNQAALEKLAEQKRNARKRNDQESYHKLNLNCRYHYRLKRINGWGKNARR